MTGFTFKCRALLLWVVVVAQMCLISAAPVGMWFEKANRFYEQQLYDSAQVYYEKVLDGGVRNADVHYNLGNTLFRLGRLGPAIVQYEKAQRLLPLDPDIRNNLRFANLTITDRLPEPEKTLGELFFERVHNTLTLRAQLWTAFVLLLLLAGGISLSLFVSHNVRLWLVYLIALTTVLLAAVGISAGVKIYRLEKTEYAIVLQPSVDAVNEPKGGTVLFTVHEGTRFQIRKRHGEWALVSLPNGYSGWVRESVLGLI